MRARVVTAPELAAPVGYAHAVVATGRLVFLGGQTALDADGHVVGETIVEQFGQAADNLLAALRAAGGRPEDIVSLQVFVTDVATYKAQLPQLGKAWRSRFGRHYPAMGLFGVTALFDAEAMIELMAQAVLP